MLEIFKKYKRWILIGVLLFCIILSSICYYVYSNRQLLFLQKETVVLEYGSSISKNVADYLSFDSLSGKDREFVLGNTELIVNIDNEENKNYPKIGKYEKGVSLKLKDSQVDVDIIVKDTVKPVFDKEIYSVEVDQGSKIPLDIFKVTDLSTFNILLDDSGVNYSVVGTYSALVSAEDSSGNKSTSDVSVIVKEKVKIEAENDSITKDKVNNSNKNNAISNDKPSTPNTPSKPSRFTPDAVGYLNASKNSDSLMIVSSSSMSNRSVKVYYLEKVNGNWVSVFTTNGIVGKNGIGKTREGDGKTPTGIYSITKLFGINSNPGTKLPYHKLTGSEYWCGGQNHYNQWVDESNQQHNCDKSADEHLINFPGHYNYTASLNYNSGNVYGKGSAIFIHCKVGSYTGGCVAIPEQNMIRFLQGVSSSTKVIIDLESNIMKY